LGIERAPVAGHSMGGTVALQFALDHERRVEKVVMVGAPISGSSLNPLLKLAGYRLIGELSWRLPFVTNLVQRWLLGGDSQEVQAMIFRDLGRASKESYFRSIGDLHRTDLRQRLSSLPHPILGIYGSEDNIVSPDNAALLADTVPHAQLCVLNQSRHFPMIDQPQVFINTLIAFLETGTISRTVADGGN
ncbi:MAG: alpha/beta hydrolase, partial [Candidatus Promineifilaceae bacterium]|nr:alpha/beta hydrolase [Candidatus Promineifilaceae bacterium]